MDKADQSTLTLKAGSSRDDYDPPWVVLYGSPSALRRQLVEVMGWEPDEERDAQPLVVLASIASIEFKAHYQLASSGAKPTTSRRSTTKKSEPAQKASTAAEPEEEAAEVADPVLKAIQDATDLIELRAAWAGNQDAFVDNRPLQAAYKEKQQELKGS